MILLKATTEILEVTTTAAVGIDYSVSFADITTTTFAPSTSEGKITTATTTTITAAPAASTQRQIKLLTLRNVNASLPNDVTVKKDISGTEYVLTPTITLLAGEVLQYMDGQGWTVYASNGAIKSDQSAAGSDTQLQYNANGTLAGDATLTYDYTNSVLSMSGTDTGILMEGITNEPAATSANQMRFYAKSVSGRMMPKFIGPSGLDTVLQAALFGNGIQVLSPNTTTTFSAIGTPSPTIVGTASTPAISAGSLRTQTRRTIITSAATANSAAEARLAATSCWLGNSAGLGGFFTSTRFATSTAIANQRIIVGLLSVTTAIATTQSPSSLTNCIIIGNDSADANLQIMHNDAAGVCTKIDLGASFPAANTSAVYESIFFASPNATTVQYRVTRLDTGAVASGTLSTDLPSNTTFLAWHAYMNNGGTASAVVLEIMRYYLETDY